MTGHADAPTLADRPDNGEGRRMTTIELGADETQPPTLLVRCDGCRDSRLIPLLGPQPLMELVWFLWNHAGHGRSE